MSPLRPESLAHSFLAWIRKRIELTAAVFAFPVRVIHITHAHLTFVERCAMEKVDEPGARVVRGSRTHALSSHDVVAFALIGTTMRHHGIFVRVLRPYTSRRVDRSSMRIAHLRCDSVSLFDPQKVNTHSNTPRP